MATRFNIKIDLPKEADMPAAKWERVRQGVEKVLRGKVKKIVIRKMSARVSNWEQRVVFSSRYAKRGNSLGSLAVFPRGEGRERWAWVSLGTRARVIVPRNAPVLRYRPGYRSKTTPGGGFGRGSARTGPMISAKQVNHPGIAARNFEEDIIKELESEEIVEILIRTAIVGALK